jgi:hypothetical protein
MHPYTLTSQSDAPKPIYGSQHVGDVEKHFFTHQDYKFASEEACASSFFLVLVICLGEIPSTKLCIC